jgi:hypothetical protein
VPDKFNLACVNIARRHFELTWEHGPGPDAFTFGKRFEVPE